MDDPADDAPPETRSDDTTRTAASDDTARTTASDDTTRTTASDDTTRTTAPDDAGAGGSVVEEPSTPVRAVQTAAIEHAFTVGPPAAGLRLAGQLAVLDDRDPDLAVLAPLVAGLVGRDAARAASPPDRSPPRPSLPAHTKAPPNERPSDSLTRRGSQPASDDRQNGGSTDAVRERDPLVRGAAIAVARHDVPLARAADAADRSLDRISRAARARRASDDHTSL